MYIKKNSSVTVGENFENVSNQYLLGSEELEQSDPYDFSLDLVAERSPYLWSLDLAELPDIT